MPAKSWEELEKEIGPNDIRSLRFAFFGEHENATKIETSPRGVPLRAIYESAEYHSERTDIPLMANTPTRNPRGLPVAVVTDDGIILDGVRLPGVNAYEASAEAGQISTLTVTFHVKLERG